MRKGLLNRINKEAEVKKTQVVEEVKIDKEIKVVESKPIEIYAEFEDLKIENHVELKQQNVENSKSIVESRFGQCVADMYEDLNSLMQIASHDDSHYYNKKDPI